jgi:CRISPR type III-B/RAMP module-associated protein Cmr3
MTPLLIEPTDVLFFRDAIPMAAGAGHGHGARLPFPSTLHEAFRASLLLASGRTVDRYTRTGREGRQVATFDFQSLRTAGPFPWQEFDAPHSKNPRGLLLPVPLDAAFDFDRTQLKRLQLWRDESVPADARCEKADDFRPPCLPVTVTPPDKHAELHGWWTLPQWQAWIDGRTDHTGDFFKTIPDTDLCQAEHRIGVEIDPARSAAAEGQLYAGAYLRLDERTRFAAQAAVRDTRRTAECDELARLDWLLLGGEQRLSRLHREGDPFAALPLPPSPGSDGPCLLAWTLVTPAIFAHGSLPGWCAHPAEKPDGLPLGRVRLGAPTASPRRARRKEGASALPGRAHLIAWRAGRPLTVSGWDAIAHAPKPTQLAVPAGSVYYFLCENADTGRDLAARLHWQPRSDHYGDKGCGYGLCSFAIEMHSQSPKSADVRALADKILNAETPA